MTAVTKVHNKSGTLTSLIVDILIFSLLQLSLGDFWLLHIHVDESILIAVVCMMLLTH